MTNPGINVILKTIGLSPENGKFREKCKCDPASEAPKNALSSQPKHKTLTLIKHPLSSF